MVVISTEIYEKIQLSFRKFHGLAIHCEQELRKKYPELDPIVITAILSKEWQKHVKNNHHFMQKAANKLLKEYVFVNLHLYF